METLLGEGMRGAGCEGPSQRMRVGIYLTLCDKPRLASLIYFHTDLRNLRELNTGLHRATNQARGA